MYRYWFILLALAVGACSTPPDKKVLIYTKNGEGYLAEFDAVIFNNTNNEAFNNDEQRFNPRIHVLLVHDLSSVEDSNKNEYPGEVFGDLFPSAWYQEFEGGREWYTTYGHNPND